MIGGASLSVESVPSPVAPEGEVVDVPPGGAVGWSLAVDGPVPDPGGKMGVDPSGRPSVVQAAATQRTTRNGRKRR